MLSDPEKSIWSSIKQLCVRSLAENTLKDIHKITNRAHRSTISRNIKLYIHQAYEFYESARFARSNTAPLFYYYSFLNLAKSLCEIKNPGFHGQIESYKHGMRWKPNSEYLTDLETDYVSTTAYGVWHKLLEIVLGRYSKTPAFVLPLKKLFSLCPEISVEYEKAFDEKRKTIEVEPDVRFDRAKNEIWINISVKKDELKDLRISSKKFFDLIGHENGIYRRVRGDNDSLMFESMPIEIGQKNKDLWFDLIKSEIRNLNLFSYLDYNKCDRLGYAVPVQTNLPAVIPQLMVPYTIMFWLGSLVRYDPHSIAYLQESKYWMMIDSFMNESRIWLLELFEREFYQRETILKTAR